MATLPALKYKTEIRVGRGGLYGEVVGKVKNANAFVVVMYGPTPHKELVKKYGLPIRYTELEWGSYTGNDSEFIIPEKDIRTR